MEENEVEQNLEIFPSLADPVVLDPNSDLEIYPSLEVRVFGKGTSSSAPQQ
jgi:hypothetical protein